MEEFVNTLFMRCKTINLRLIQVPESFYCSNILINPYRSQPCILFSDRYKVTPQVTYYKHKFLQQYVLEDKNKNILNNSTDKNCSSREWVRDADQITDWSNLLIFPKISRYTEDDIYHTQHNNTTSTKIPDIANNIHNNKSVQHEEKTTSDSVISTIDRNSLKDISGTNNLTSGSHVTTAPTKLSSKSIATHDDLLSSTVISPILFTEAEDKISSSSMKSDIPVTTASMNIVSNIESTKTCDTINSNISQSQSTAIQNDLNTSINQPLSNKLISAIDETLISILPSPYPNEKLLLSSSSSSSSLITSSNHLRRQFLSNNHSLPPNSVVSALGTPKGRTGSIMTGTGGLSLSFQALSRGISNISVNSNNSGNNFNVSNHKLNLSTNNPNKVVFNGMSSIHSHYGVSGPISLSQHSSTSINPIIQAQEEAR